MKMFYSSVNNGFYDEQSALPEDALEITESRYSELIAGIEGGKFLSANENGLPVLTEPPQPTYDELVAVAELLKQQLINSAMQSISVIQLKLQAARTLTAAEKVKMNAVLDYIDEVTATDITTAPENITWPTQPEI